MSHRVRRLLLVAFLLGLTSTLRAEEPTVPLPRRELDRRIAVSLHDTVNLGADIFNHGNHEGCYRLYQGTLQTLLPLLDHRPEVKAKAEAKMRKAESLRSAFDQAFLLREAIDDVNASLRKDLRETPRAVRSLWDRLGGEEAVRAVVHDFVLRAAKNPQVNFDRNGQFTLDGPAVAALEQRLVELVSAVGGGPLKYTGRSMKDAHKGMKITDAEFNALAGDLKATLEKFKVPMKEQEELLKVVGSTRADIVEKK